MIRVVQFASRSDPFNVKFPEQSNEIVKCVIVDIHCKIAVTIPFFDYGSAIMMI